MNATEDRLAELTKAVAELRLGTRLRLCVPGTPGTDAAASMNHEIVIMRTNEEGFHSGRPRYLVACRTCMKLLHEATTGPVENARWHVQGFPGYT